MNNVVRTVVDIIVVVLPEVVIDVGTGFVFVRAGRRYALDLPLSCSTI